MTLQHFARSTNLLYQAAPWHPLILYFVNDKKKKKTTNCILVQAPCASITGIRHPSSVTLSGLTLRVRALLPSDNVVPCLTRKLSCVPQTGDDGKFQMLTLCDRTIPTLPSKNHEGKTPQALRRGLRIQNTLWATVVLYEWEALGHS